MTTLVNGEIDETATRRAHSRGQGLGGCGQAGVARSLLSGRDHAAFAFSVLLSVFTYLAATNQAINFL
jgi:hypothetical protein